MKNKFVMFYSIDKRFYLYIDSIIINKMRLMYEKNVNKETGGIIIGYYSKDLKKAYITSATDAPVDSIKGFSTFFRGIRGIKKLLLKLWDKKMKEYYLGEWHYHPTSNIKLSNVDIQQMQSISQNLKINCPEPILLIIGKNNGFQNNNLKAFIFPRNEKYIILKEHI